MQGRGLEGPVYAAARKVAELQPLNPSALNTLGLAAEARGDFGGAAKAFQAALQLLPSVGEAACRAGGGSFSVWVVHCLLPALCVVLVLADPQSKLCHTSIHCTSKANHLPASLLETYLAAGSDPGAALRHATSAHAGVGGGAAAPLGAAVRLNLSRTLCKAGHYEEAMSLYGEMEYMAG